MRYWVLFFIGIFMTWNSHYQINDYTIDGRYPVKDCRKNEQIKMHFLVIGCIILVGGLASSGYIGFFTDFLAIFEEINNNIFLLIPIILIYMLCFQVLYLKYFQLYSNIIFIIVFVVSIFGWITTIQNYKSKIQNYNANIEYINGRTMKILEQREVLSLGKDTSQKITGEVNGSSNFFSGSVDGSISTSDEIPYWYVGKNNESLYDSVDARASKILPTSSSPRIEIIEYVKFTKEINHNNGKTYIQNYEPRIEYVFYLPKDKMLYFFETY